ncbi:MAG: hypothetical protein QHC90_08000 [Shinella sp.]|nr:hypothetical protein [Shinella sp.]
MMKLHFLTAALIGFSTLPSFAALPDPDDYSEPFSEGGLQETDYTSVAGRMCIPPEPQYVPSLVREPGGNVVGVDVYLIEYEC